MSQSNTITLENVTYYSNGTDTNLWNILCSNENFSDKTFTFFETGRSFSIVEILFFIFVPLLGAIGNLMTCIAIVLDKRLQTVMNYCLFSLSVANFLVSVVFVPSMYFVIKTKFDSTNFYLCHLFILGKHALVTTSGLHICSMSIERYKAIKNPLNISRPPKSRLIVNNILWWLLGALIIGIPFSITVFRNSRREKQGVEHCRDLKDQFLVILTETVMMTLLMVVVFYTCIRTVVILHKLGKERRLSRKGSRNGIIRSLPTCVRSGQPQIDKSEKKALLVVWFLSFSFIITALPVYVLLLVHLFTCEKTNISHIFKRLFFYIRYVFPIIDPIIYMLFIKRFRDNYKNIILFRFKAYKNVLR